MKKFIKFIKEDAAPPASFLNNPAYMHNDYNEALDAAKKLSITNPDVTDRAYIIKYKYYRQTNQKPFIVAHNKMLVDQEPNWDAKGYDIVGWVSNSDGVVTKTQDGKYVKGQQQ
jgi:hypothetical protein